MYTWPNRWRALWNPPQFHGWGKKKSYFEGWYYKIVSADKELAMAVIPGISFDKEGKGHAFIQVMDGIAHKMDYFEFDVSAFWPDSRRFALRIEDNYFSQDKIKCQLPNLNIDCSFSGHVDWPRQFGAPGIMGWYAFVPFMECYHDVISMHHDVQGHVVRSGQSMTLDNGRGYLEKDWGTSFPGSWIWIQANHFDAAESPVSLFASVARIPWIGRSFIGFIAGFLWEDRIYRFSTYQKSKRKTLIKTNGVALLFTSRTHSLEINGVPGPGVPLRSPVLGQMAGKVNESLQARLEVIFRDQTGKILFRGRSDMAGLELAGPVSELVHDGGKRP